MRPRPTWMVLSLLLASSVSRIALADAPSGPFTVSFDGEAAIWNPFDGFTACESISGATMCLILENVECNGVGKCFGDASVEFSGILDGFGSGPFEASTRCVATENPDDAICTARLLIEELDGFVNQCDFSLTKFKVKGPVDSDGFYEGKASLGIQLNCPTGDDKASLKGLFQYEVNPPTPWSLTVTPQPDAKNPLKFTGTATDSLGFSYAAKGVHSTKKGKSKFVLQGPKNTWSAGAKVKLNDLVLQGSNVQGGTANIKVQGNKIPYAPLGP